MDTLYYVNHWYVAIIPMNHFLFNIQILRNPIFILLRWTKTFCEIKDIIWILLLCYTTDCMETLGNISSIYTVVKMKLLFKCKPSLLSCSVSSLGGTLKLLKPQINDRAPQDTRSFHFNMLQKWCSYNLTFIFWHFDRAKSTLEPGFGRFSLSGCTIAQRGVGTLNGPLGHPSQLGHTT